MSQPPLNLLPPQDSDNLPLALRPLLIAGMPSPVHDADGGINLQMATQFPQGLLVLIDPYLRMQAGDRLEVVWDGQVLASHTVAAGEENTRIVLFLPLPDAWTAQILRKLVRARASHLGQLLRLVCRLLDGQTDRIGQVLEQLTTGEQPQDSWAEQVLYRLTRNGTATPEDSIALRLRIKLDLPGDYDRDPHLPGHSQLPAPKLPQDVVDNGVDAAWAARGVPVEVGWYDNRAAWDVIELHWGNVPLLHTVSEAEAGGRDPVMLNVDQATILAAGDSPSLLVHYQVRDEVHNFSEDWSLRTVVGVEAGAWKLDAPFVKEAPNDILDLSVLGDADATVQLEARAPTFAYGDTVTVTWLTLLNDQEIARDTVAQMVVKLPDVVEVPIPNHVVRQGAKGRIVASYVLTPVNGNPPLSSKRANISIVGDVPLPAPAIFELIGDRLDATLERAHAVIPAYEGMAVGDAINIIWLGTRADGTPHLHEVVHIVSNNEKGKPIYQGVTAEHIGLLAGGSLDLSYKVINDATALQAIRQSSHLKVVVAPLPVQLPAPTVDEAPEDVLDPELHPRDVTLRVSYSGTLKGDILTWYWLGDDADEGSAKDWIPITTSNAGKPVTFPIVRQLVEANLNSTVQVLYTLKRASTGQFEYSAVLNLVIGRLIGDLPPPVVEEANINNQLDPMQARTGVTVTVKYPSMELDDLITLRWLGTPGSGTPPEQQLPASASGQVQFKVPATVIGANIGQQVTVAYVVKRNSRENLSDPTLLTITPIADEHLPTPAIPQAQANVLNLATFAGDARCTVAPPWPFIIAGQRVWLFLEGRNANGGPQRIDLLDGAPLSATQVRDGLDQPVPRASLALLGQDTPLIARCKVGFADNADETGALPLPPRPYTFKAHHDWVVPVITRVEDADGVIADGGSTFQNRVTLTGTATLESQVELFDGNQSKGPAQAGADGRWSLVLSSLAPKAYVLTAHALDGSGHISQPRRFEVLENLTPSIIAVRDSRGNLANGGTTIDTSLTLDGLASPGRQVEVFDGTVPKGRANTDAIGAWTLTVSGLTVATHAFKAKALYGTGNESNLWQIIVAATVTPTIASVRDSRREVPANGYTVEQSVTVTGTGTANLEVELFDNNQSRGTLTVGTNGQWSTVLQNLAQGAHPLKVRARYGSQPESGLRQFNVTADVAPNITRVVDPQGASVGNQGSTYATTVTASGTAAPGQEITLFDGAASKGNASVDGNGNWSLQVTGLSVGSHALKARAVYGSDKESGLWSFTVKAAVAPTLTSVRDSRGEVANGGSTTDTSVTASGSAAANEQVEVFDGNISKGTTTVNGAGNWSRAVTGLAIGAHSLKAVARYSDGMSSNTRSFTVRQPFALDPSTVNLSGRVYLLPGYPHLTPAPWPAGTTYRRVPSSGVAPYSYTSSNPLVVSVDANGTVTSRGNGSASITVRDSQGNSGTYTVIVSNVIHVIGLGRDSFTNASNAAASRGKRLPNLDELNQIYAAYAGRWPMGNSLYWSTTAGTGINRRRCKNLVTGGWQDLSAGWGSHSNIVAI
ncbi:Ig-like domain repeat protein [Pseudomonas oryziphila]|uniref:Ig-like domain (Group 2) n=1 Tax=Pseudomonas oryziphila TaxID=2894079 RepID=A0ABN5TD10_9PSED|nr:Ig-like domain repeat protein [Pseudomonas oryziphila]AZL72819.1 hypothetical protein EI693_06815 [Pseudomonas oryziphila]